MLLVLSRDLPVAAGSVIHGGGVRRGMAFLSRLFSVKGSSFGASLTGCLSWCFRSEPRYDDEKYDGEVSSETGLRSQSQSKTGSRTSLALQDKTGSRTSLATQDKVGSRTSLAQDKTGSRISLSKSKAGSQLSVASKDFMALSEASTPDFTDTQSIQSEKTRPKENGRIFSFIHATKCILRVTTKQFFKSK